MADITITAASVISGANAVKDHGTAGATIIAGKTVLKDPTTSKYVLSDSNAAGLKGVDGIALNGASDGQPLAVQTGGDLTIGATVVAGTSYYLSETPGGIEPGADLGSGEDVVLIGIAKSTTVIALHISAVGVTL